MGMTHLDIQPTAAALGRWGRARRDFLKENRPQQYRSLAASGRLILHCLQVEDAATERLDWLIPQLAKTAGATEQLKAADAMKWVGLMNACRNQAEEIILEELIFS